MKKLFAAVPALFFLTFFPFFLRAEEQFTPRDFAGAMTLSGKEGSLLFTEIPEEVYRGLRRPDLGDIRIFDGNGMPLPFIIRESPKALFTPEPEDLPFFLWDGGRENSFPGGTDIEINTQGGVVRIKNSEGSGQSSKTFLADLSGLKYVPSMLRLQFENSGNNFNTTVSVYYSGDLSSWKSFPGKQTIASFASPVSGASSGTLRDTLELPAPEDIKNLRYLLLAFGEGAPAPSGMTALFHEREKAGEYHEIMVSGVKSGDGRKVNYYTGAYYPAESIDFVFEEADSIRVFVRNRFTEKEEWNVIAEESIFRYKSAEGIEKNLPLEISSGAPFFELEASGELPFGSAPALVVRFKKKELVFPGRGKGPWTLAWGNAEAPPLEADITLPSGGVFEEANFTGEKRYEERIGLASPGGSGRRVIFLWIFLGAASLVLSVLAFYIAKSMRK